MTRAPSFGVSTVERTAAMPAAGAVAAFDAGWYAHEIGFDRDTVHVLSANPGWALLGYDSRAAASSQASAKQ